MKLTKLERLRWSTSRILRKMKIQSNLFLGFQKLKELGPLRIDSTRGVRHLRLESVWKWARKKIMKTSWSPSDGTDQAQMILNGRYRVSCRMRSDKQLDMVTIAKMLSTTQALLRMKPR